MNLKKMFSFLFLLILFASCNDYEKLMGPALKIKLADKNPSPVFDGENEPAMPNPSDNDKTVLGIDSNGNGIRDDVDIWINRTALDYNERMAMRQYARAQQEVVRVCQYYLKDEGNSVQSELANSHNCLRALSGHRRQKEDRENNGDGYIEKKLDLLMPILNSDRCNQFYNRYGTLVTIINSSHSDLNCKFKVENLEAEVKLNDEWSVLDEK